ncbi:MAG: hypothetical protein HFG39_10280 [Lachnospiraceae bacterium]|nr:hypothetical protein [Lachnospiraceae bacterium]
MIKDRIKNCIKNIVGGSAEIEEDVDIKVYGIDSLLKVQLVIALEEEFNVSFQDDDINQNNFETINAIIELLRKYNV